MTEATDSTRRVTSRNDGKCDKTENETAEQVVNVECGRECAICLQPYNLSVEIPCGHVFCFLCIKGVCARNSRCPLCRQEVPVDYFHRPTLVTDEICKLRVNSKPQPPDSNSGEPPVESTASSRHDAENTSNTKPDAPSASQCSPKTSPAIWYYEGRNGWWRYDDRTMSYLEEAYTRDSRPQSVETMISGYMYVVDLLQMVQYRKDEPTRRRQVRREISSEPSREDNVLTIVKGIAGLKLPTDAPAIELK